MEWGGGKLGDLLSEWGRRRPDTRERKRNRIHAVPPPPRLSWEEGKWGTKDAHGPQLRSLDIQGHRETPHPTAETSHARPRPSPELGRGWERGRVTTRVHDPSPIPPRSEMER